MDDADDLIAMFGKITTNDHSSLTDQFSRIMQVDAATANFFLEASAWNVEVAVHNFLQASANNANGSRALSTQTPPQAVYCSGLEFLEQGPAPRNTLVNLNIVFGNNGEAEWPLDTQFVFVQGECLSANRSVPISCSPNSQCMVELRMQTPNQPGSYAGTWRLACSAGYFGDPLWIIIGVDERDGEASHETIMGHDPNSAELLAHHFQQQSLSDQSINSSQAMGGSGDEAHKFDMTQEQMQTHHLQEQQQMLATHRQQQQAMGDRQQHERAVSVGQIDVEQQQMQQTAQLAEQQQLLQVQQSQQAQLKQRQDSDAAQWLQIHAARAGR
jgi:hypothetical protein